MSADFMAESECDMDLVKLQKIQRQSQLLQDCIYFIKNTVGFPGKRAKEGNNGEVFLNYMSKSVKAEETPRLPSY